jgi:hypothetical protein
VVCAVVVSLSGSAEAAAAGRVLGVGDPGPVTATVPWDDGVAWAASSRRRHLVAVSVPGGTRVLARLPAARIPEAAVSLEAVDGQLGVTRWDSVCLDDHDCKYGLYSYVGTDLLAAPAGGALTRVAGCTPVLECARECEVPPSPRLTVGGGAVAVWDACARRGTLVEANGTVRDLSGVVDVALAGPWAALGRSDPGRGSPWTSVVRRSDWTEVARLPAASGVWLQADGTVALHSFGADERLRLASPPAWAPRDIMPPALFERPTGLAGGRLMLVRADADGTTLTVRATSGRVLRQHRLGPVPDHAVGFAGSRITWPRKPCGVTSLVSWDLDTDRVPPAVPGRCGAVRVVGRRATVRERRLQLRVACPARHEQGCRGTLRLLGLGVAGWAFESLALAPGRAEDRTIAIPARALRLVHRRGRVRATAVFDARRGRDTRQRVTISAAT